MKQWLDIDIEIIITKDNSIKDDGRGRINWYSYEKSNINKKQFIILHAGGKFGGSDIKYLGITRSRSQVVNAMKELEVRYQNQYILYEI